MTIFLSSTPDDVERYQFTLGTSVLHAKSAAELSTLLHNASDQYVVIIGPDVALNTAIEIADHYRTSKPEISVILQRRRLDISVLSQALRAGIRDVVDADDAESLVKAHRTAQELAVRFLGSDAEGEHLSRTGKLVVVFSPKGGTGKTMVATNLAVAIANQGSKTCLVDFDLQFGDVAIALQIEPLRTSADALGMRGTFDDHGIASLLTPYRPNLNLLLGPTRPADAEFISSDLAQELLTGLLRQHEYVVVDTPPAFTEVVLKALDLADVHVLITTPDMSSLKNLRIAMDTLDALGYPREKRIVVLNRLEPNLGIQVKDIEHLVRLPMSARVPLDREVVVCLNRGTTIIENEPKHVVSRVLQDVANSVSAMPKTHKQRISAETKPVRAQVAS
jgi:pilus assembly protein CpaE